MAIVMGFYSYLEEQGSIKPTVKPVAKSPISATPKKPITPKKQEGSKEWWDRLSAEKQQEWLRNNPEGSAKQNVDTGSWILKSKDQPGVVQKGKPKQGEIEVKPTTPEDLLPLDKQEELTKKAYDHVYNGKEIDLPDENDEDIKVDEENDKYWSNWEEEEIKYMDERFSKSMKEYGVSSLEDVDNLDDRKKEKFLKDSAEDTLAGGRKASDFLTIYYEKDYKEFVKKYDVKNFEELIKKIEDGVIDRDKFYDFEDEIGELGNKGHLKATMLMYDLRGNESKKKIEDAFYNTPEMREARRKEEEEQKEIERKERERAEDEYKYNKSSKIGNITKDDFDLDKEFSFLGTKDHTNFEITNEKGYKNNITVLKYQDENVTYHSTIKSDPDPERREVHLNYMEFEDTGKSGTKHNIKNIIDSHMVLGKKYDIKKLTLHADIDIGMYAWARAGMDYDYSKNEPYDKLIEDRRSHFIQWCKKYDIKVDIKEIETFIRPNDFASFDIPDKYIDRNEISSSVRVTDSKLKIGKAYMLDRKGHGDWSAVLIDENGD